MWPKNPVNPELIKIDASVKLPPEVAELAARLGANLDQLLQMAWLDGLRTGALFTSLGMLILWFVIERLRK